MTKEQLYNIEKIVTQGWELADSESKNLTREQCEKKLGELLEEMSPECIRIVSAND